MTVEPFPAKRVKRRRVAGEGAPTLAERVNDHESRITSLEGVADAVNTLSSRFKRWGIVVLLALAASGVIEGPWGKFLTELAATVAR